MTRIHNASLRVGEEENIPVSRVVHLLHNRVACGLTCVVLQTTKETPQTTCAEETLLNDVR